MPLNFRPHRNDRGYYELDKKVSFLDRVEFLKGAGMLPDRSVEFYVDGLFGSDNYDGLSMDQPKATIAAAITAMNARIDWAVSPWAKGDVLYIAPGCYAENLTALPYGCTIIGLGDAFDLNGEKGVVIKPATGAAVDCTSIINSKIENIAFMQKASATHIFQADNFNRNVMKHVVFAGIPGPSPTTTRGFEVVKDCTGNKMIDAFFIQVKNGIYIVTDNAAEKQISGTIFDDITMGAVSEKGFHFDVNCNPCAVFVKNSNIGDNQQTLALGMDDDSDKVAVSNTNFWATANDPATGGTYYNNCYLNGTLIK